MDDRAVTQRELEIDVGSEPIRGRLRAADQPPRGFVGWFELFAAIEELRGGDSPVEGGVPEGEESR